MKKFYILILGAFMIISNAQASSELFLKINKNGRYTVTIDDNTISSRNNIFRFYDLSNGTLLLRVTENNFYNTLVFQRAINLQNGYRIVAELDNNWNLQIIQQFPYQKQEWYLDQVYSNGYGNWNPTYPPTSYPQPCPPPKHGHGNGNGNWNPNYPNNPGYPYPYPPYPPIGNYPIGYVMDNTSVQNLKTTMKNMSFDDSMLQVAKTALKNSAVTTAQVGDLMSVFSFENSKLDFAKYAYDKTVDKQNYYQLYDDFTFSSSATDLDKYIASR